MAATSEKPKELFIQTRDYFDSHPIISISPPEDDTPNQFEIIYSLTGMCKGANGDIIESSTHTIELSIPFGFPHFPPSCKPKSDIFHPDFDPAAICLGEFWHQDRTIPNLIVYIGKMINGEMYSTSNAFNEDAADWYNKHSSTFPLANIQWGDTNFPADGNHNTDQEIDTLDDSDLSSGFDYLSLDDAGSDEEISLDTSFTEPESPIEIDLHLLQLLDRKKRYNKLNETIAKDEHSTEESVAFSTKAKNEIEKATKLHASAKRIEDRGNPQKALEMYQQVGQIVSDFYGLSADIARAKQTLSLLNDFSPQAEPSTEKIGPDINILKKTKKSLPAKENKTDVPKKRPEDSFFSGTPKSSKLPLYVATLLLVSCLIAGGYFYFSLHHNLATARKTYGQCTSSLAKNAFAKAKESCDAALLATRNIKYLSQQETRELKEKISATLNSVKLTQGLAGNVLFQGHYYSKSEAKALQILNESFKQAENLYALDKWKQALQIYRKMLPEAEANKNLEKSIVETIKIRIKQTQFRIEYYLAADFFNASDWNNASKKFEQAKKLSHDLLEKDRLIFAGQLDNYLLTSKFKKLKNDGDRFFSQANWKNAVSSYSLALASIKGSQFSTTDTTLEIMAKIKKAELYATINRGNITFASGSWNQAIDAYTKAGSFIEKNKDILSLADSALSRKKIYRIILQASIIRERQAARKQLQEDNYNAAKKSYHTILTVIAQSEFTAETEFIETRDKILSALQAIDHKILIAEKKNYLNKNYQQLFSTNYLATTPDTLKNPIISLAEEKSNLLIFKLQCTETGRGRPLTLVMYYAFNTATSQWGFYSQKQQ